MRRLGPAASLVICLAVLLFSTNQVKSYLLTSCATTRKHGNGSLRSRSNSTRIALSSLPDESEEAKYFDRFFELTMDMEDKYPKDNNLALINSVNLAKTLDNLVKLRQTDATATHSRIYELEQRVGQLESQIAEMRRMHLKLLQVISKFTILLFCFDLVVLSVGSR